MAKYLKLNDIDSYKRALKLSNYVWDIVVKWKWFPKQVVGVQYTKAVDSVSAIIAEGFGRHFKKDKIHFYRMARGSVIESMDWNYKSNKRSLLEKSEYKYISKELNMLPKEINQLIKYTDTKLKE